MKNLLVVHHDADLYGADRSLLLSLQALRKGPYAPVVVVPRHGPLVELIEAEGIEVHIGPVGKLTRQLMRPTALPHLAADLMASMRFMSRVAAGRPIQLVYSNSVSALGGALWAAFRRVPRLWHVREIVVAPRAAAAGFPLMLRLLGGACVCNSHATRDWIVREQPALATRSSVIWNGLGEVPSAAPEAAARFRQSLGVGEEEVLVALVGRINRWKGQGVLIDAAALLEKQMPRRVRYVIVGDVADDQRHFRESMLEKIAQLGLQDRILWHPFVDDVSVVWSACDIAVAPSTEPEPFGRVAIEAMAYRLPVVAAGHGGLAEIVQHEATGLLVKPGDATELAEAIARLAASPALRAAYGDAGRARQRSEFTQQQHDAKLLELIARCTDARD